MFAARNSPRYISLHRLCKISGRSRSTVLIRIMNDELSIDGMLKIGGREVPIFFPERVAELKRLPALPASTLNPML